MTTGYNVVDSCVLFFIFSFSSLLLVPPRRFFTLVFDFFLILYFSYVFSLEMVSSEQILGSNDSGVGRSVLCIPCLVPMCVIYPLVGTSRSRFLHSQKSNNLAFIFFFSAMCVIDDERCTRARWLRPRDDFRVDETGYAGEMWVCVSSCPFLYSSTIRSFLFLHIQMGQ